MKGKFYLSDHQGKGRAYVEALESAGYVRVQTPADDPDFAFYDHDVGAGGNGFRQGLDFLHAKGVPVFLYPHAARPMLQWDGMYPVWPHTVCNYTIAPGHKAVMEAFGYPVPVEVMGWTYCEISPPAPLLPRRLGLKGGGRLKVLFGPIHPNGNGWMHPVDKQANAAVLKLLLQTPGIELTVRHIKRVDLSGIWKANHVRYVLGKANQCITEIDQADVVIAHQTFAYLAAARGKPLIMFGDQVKPHSGNKPENFRWVASWEKYRGLMQYPLEVENAEGPEGLRAMMEQAMREDVGAVWRERFVGKPFEAQAFVRSVENHIHR